MIIYFFFIIDLVSTLGGRLYHGRDSVMIDTRFHFFYLVNLLFIFFLSLLIVLLVHCCVEVECSSVMHIFLIFGWLIYVGNFFF